jgi:tagatose-1,6-bisphosphate aldolase
MCRVVYSGALALILLSLAVPRVAVAAGVPNGVWRIHAKVAVQIFACGKLLCGRIVWLQHPRDQTGQLVQDLENPDPALRQRPLCGQTIHWGL